MIYENSQEGKCPRCGNTALAIDETLYSLKQTTHIVYCEDCEWEGREIYYTKFLRMEDGEK